MSWITYKSFTVHSLNPFVFSKKKTICIHVNTCLNQHKFIIHYNRDLHKVLGQKQKMISNSLMSLQWLDLGLVCLPGCNCSALRSPLETVVFSASFDTQLITGVGETPPLKPHAHTNKAPMRRPSQPSPSLAPLRQAREGTIYACSILSPSLSWKKRPLQSPGKCSHSGIFFRPKYLQASR